MLVFWVVCAAFMLVTLAYVLSPFLRRSHNATPASAELNLETYRQRMGELQREHDDGILPEREFVRSQRDLETELIQHLRGSVPDSTEPRAGITGARSGAVVVAVCVPLLALGLYGYYGRIHDVLSTNGIAGSEPSTRPTEADQAELPSIEEMAAGLEQRLQTSPDDAEGWVMLGRTKMAMGDFAAARDAYARAYTLLGDTAGLLADYAEADILANSGAFSDTAQQLISKELQLSPTSEKGLWLAGFGAYRSGNQRQAVRLWRTLLASQPAENAVTTQVRDLIAQTEAQLGSAIVDVEDNDASEPAAMAAATKAVTVSVRLDDKLTDRATPSETVFVFARAVDGPTMPLAVARLQVKDLPVTVTLDDSMAMMPAMKISNFGQVVVGARVSKTGKPQPQSGDLQGVSSPVTVGRDQIVTITIEEIVP